MKWAAEIIELSSDSDDDGLSLLLYECEKQESEMRRKTLGGMELRDNPKKKKGTWVFPDYNNKYNNDDDDDEYIASRDVEDPVVRSSAPSQTVLPPKDKEEEEDDVIRFSESESEETKKRSRAQAEMIEQDIDNDEMESVYDMEEEEEEVLSPSIRNVVAAPAKKSKSMETESVTLDEISKVVQINTMYLDKLIVARESLMRYPLQYGNGSIVTEIGKSIKHTLEVLSTWCPVTQSKPVEKKTVPIDIPMADGTEVRFTNVARDIGISWSTVDPVTKQRIYDRACELHKELYGAIPRRVNMWTNAGFRPVYYYNKDTYKGTMVRALREYIDGTLHLLIREK